MEFLSPRFFLGLDMHLYTKNDEKEEKNLFIQ